MKRLQNNRYFSLGTMLLVVISICMVLLAIILNLQEVGSVIGTITGAFRPVVVGLVFAYLLNPLMKFLDGRLYPFLLKKKMKQQKAYKLSRAVSLVFALLCALILLYEFFDMLLPQLYESVMGIVNNFNTYYAAAEKWVLGILEGDPTLAAKADDLMNQLFEFLKKWLNDGLLPSIEVIVSTLTSSVFSVVGSLLNLVIGLCAAIYMLWSRDVFIAQGKKIVVALCREKTADRIFDLFRRIHKVFSGFIIGKILDSLIIGILCYIGMLIFRMPHPALIATVVGVTNVIPFFGPFIGAVPSAFLILLVDPMQAVYFAIFVFALQQLDGNVIGPRILGNTIGISGFWVLVSITVAGSLFGFAGMILGVPVFAVLYMLVTDFIEGRLKKKGRPVPTADYYAIQKVEDLEQTEPEEPEA